MRCLVLFSIVALAVAINGVSYKGYKVYRLKPSSQDQLDFLNKLEDTNEYDFWSQTRAMNEKIDLMVSPSNQEVFKEHLEQYNIKYEILIQDVERVIQNERIAQIRAPKASNGQITFTKYHSYSEIQAYLHLLQEKYPNLVRLHNPGKSVLGHELTIIQISTDHEANKPVLFIEGGIHAREWISPATVLYIIKELVQNTANRYLLEHFDWHIIPLLNPDGYEYSRDEERLWRKNRTPNPNTECIGVDLNRNFGEHWGGLGASKNPCSLIYIGEGPFSEPEALAIKEYLLSQINNTKLYIAFHSFGCLIMHPWGYSYKLPEDAEELKHVGERAADAIQSVYNTKYRVGSITQFLTLSPGGSIDWTKAQAGIKYSYGIELPGGGKYGFDLPPDQILKAVTEFFEGIRSIHDYLATNLQH